VSPEEEFFSVSGELAKNTSFVRKYKPLAELEEELFGICRDYEGTFVNRGVTLACVTTMFPLMQVTNRGSTTEQLEAEVEEVILKQPWELADYRWVERVISFLNLLCMKWELIEPSLYSYRNTPVPSDPVLLQQYKLRQVWVFTMETIWFACAADKRPLRNRLPREVVELARKFQANTLELIRMIASLNFRVNYKLHPSISHDLCLLNEEERLHFTHKLPSASAAHLVPLSTMGKHVQMDADMDKVVRAMGQSALVNGALGKTAKAEYGREAEELRQVKSKEVGFHLLELPNMLLACLEREAFRDNLKLKEYLIAYEKLYRVLDCQMIHSLISSTPSEPVQTERACKLMEIQDEMMRIPENSKENMTEKGLVLDP
jgi:hypothetical protein